MQVSVYSVLLWFLITDNQRLLEDLQLIMITGFVSNSDSTAHHHTTYVGFITYKYQFK